MGASKIKNTSGESMWSKGLGCTLNLVGALFLIYVFLEFLGMVGNLLY